jgi:multidrug efflux pump subunit AcrB
LEVEHPLALAIIVCITLPLGLAFLFAPLSMLRALLRTGMNVNGITPLDPVERREMRRMLEHEPKVFRRHYKRVVVVLYGYTVLLLLFGTCGLLIFLGAWLS